MKLLTIVQIFKLPIFLAIGVAGSILTVVADGIQNKGRQFAIQENWSGEDEKPSIPKKKKQQILLLNIIGYSCMLSSFLLLLYYGYFDNILAMLFG